MSTSAHAKKHWYCGLTGDAESDPVLIARSSTEPYRYEDHAFRFWFPNGSKVPEFKLMSAIGTHPILTAYDKHLRPRVLEALALVPWQTVDIVRLGFADCRNNPPVILVTVKEDADEYLVQAAVDQIRSIMVEHGFLDVHAEAKTGRLYPQVTYSIDAVVPPEFKQTPKVGCSIGNASTGAGTLCLYVKIQGKMYGLTCKHVLLPMDLTTPDKPIPDHSTVAVDRAMVFQPARIDIEKLEWLNTERMAHNLRWMDNFTVEQAKAKPGWVPHPRRADRRHYDMLRELHCELKAKKARFDSFKPFMPFGVVHTVLGSLKNPVHGCTRDWVLFKLFDDRLREPPRNVFPWMEAEFRNDRRVTEAHRRPVSIRYTMDAASEILTVTGQGGIIQFNGSQDHNLSRPVGVLKHGRSTGWTCGILNEVRSDCRHVRPGQADVITTEWCVLIVPHTTQFSSEGDSGAAVIDYDGKIVGMVHRGNAKSERYRAEITYVTPMDWIIEDIKATMGTDDVILEEYIWDGVGDPSL